MSLAKKNGGFTLVELLVTIAVMGIVLAAVTGVFVSGLNTARRTAARYSEQSTALTLMKGVTRRVENSTAAAVYDTPDAGPDVSDGSVRLSYSAANGGLQVTDSDSTTFDCADVSPDETVRVTFRKAAAAKLEISVTVAAGGDADGYTLTSNVTLDNLSSTGGAGEITDATTDAGHTGALLVYKAYQPPA